VRSVVAPLQTRWERPRAARVDNRRVDVVDERLAAFVKCFVDRPVAPRPLATFMRQAIVGRACVPGVRGGVWIW